MGKVNQNKDLEIVDSVQYNQQKNKTNIFKMNKNMYLSDPSIIPRIQKYLETNLNSQYIDINVMADDLQRKYNRDYGKRKRNAFRSLVKKAYGIVMQSYGVSNDSASEDISDDSAVDDSANYGNNSLNNEIMNMYNKNIPKPIDENELIDISSDDSIDVDTPDTPLPTNGPSSSNVMVPPHFLEAILVETTPTPNANEITKTPNSVSNEKSKKRKAESNNKLIAPKKKKMANISHVQEPKLSFKDVGGLDKILMDVCKLLVHVKHPEVYRQIGISPPRGFLLHGPPGSGKTLLANAIAGELEVALIKVSAPELVAGVSGESEERIRELFERAVVSSPCVLFIDEIDAITPNRQLAQKEMERRIVAQLLTCIDDLSKNENGDQILIIGATNRPDALDPALRRAGRFDREISLGIPNCEARLDILKVLTSRMKLEDNFDFESLAKFTPGFVGADLMSLTREAAMFAVNRIFHEMKEKTELAEAIKQQEIVTSNTNDINNKASDEETKKLPEVVENNEEKPQEPEVSDNTIVIEDDTKKADSTMQQLNDVNNVEIETPKVITPLEELLNWLHKSTPLSTEQLSGLFITSEDFAKALKTVQPSAKREGFATVPDTTWNDVGSLSDIREELQMAILAPVRHEEQFNLLGLTTQTGVLLCGPPGCGKTLLAKAIANEAGINFISVKGPELLNMYVGESERAVRLCFERARNSAPCVIFFDELDALCPKRSDSREGGSTMRVVNQLLTEMDGIQSRKGVYILAASNRPDIIDPAVLRPGRLDKILYVGLPSPIDRVDILRTITKNGQVPMLALDVDLETIGKSDECEGYTGADLAALVREAGVQALREVMLQGDITKPTLVTTAHFTKAVAKIRPSISEKDKQHYNKLKKIYSVKQPEIEEMEYS